MPRLRHRTEACARAVHGGSRGAGGEVYKMYLTIAKRWKKTSQSRSEVSTGFYDHSRIFIEGAFGVLYQRSEPVRSGRFPLSAASAQAWFAVQRPGLQITVY
eukprot:s1101_g14.t1